MYQTRVLVVDDHESIVRHLAALLELEGFAVACATDGESALKAFDNFLPDVVVLDLALPRPSGAEVADAIRDRVGDEVVLIAHSAFDEALLDNAHEHGTFDAYISKGSDFSAVDAVRHAIAVRSNRLH